MQFWMIIATSMSFVYYLIQTFFMFVILQQMFVLALHIHWMEKEDHDVYTSNENNTSASRCC